MKKPRRAPNRTATRRETTPIIAHLDHVRRQAQSIRVADPLERLRDLQAIEKAAAAAIAASIEDARLAQHSWSTIGGVLGVSKQAAQQRYTTVKTS